MLDNPEFQRNSAGEATVLSDSMSNPTQKWGGRRAGAGRKRKKATATSQQSPKSFRSKLHTGKTWGWLDFTKGILHPLTERGCPKQRGKLITSGTIRDAPKAYIYIGRKSDAVLKIGMSASPDVRCKGLGIKLLHAVAVVGAAARMMETYTLQELGALVGDTEYVKCSLNRAIEAIHIAWAKAERIVHVDPDITADEARLRRIAILAKET